MTVDAAKIIAIAKAEIGYHEGRSNGHWNNDQKYSKAVPGMAWSNYQAWCCTFVAWCAMLAGESNLYPRTASCLTAVSWFRQQKRFSQYPAVGAQIFFGSGGGSHTGIVTDYDGTYVYTVEGNTNDSGSAEGDGVYAKKHARRDAHVYGYGYPRFASGIKSADPAYAKEAPKPEPKPTTPPAKTPSKPAPAKPKPTVDLSNVVAAAHADPSAPQGHTSHKADVLIVEKALVAEKLLDAKWADGSFGTKTKDAYEALQERYGYSGTDADGIPGKASLTRLGNAHGFFVKA
ncbi:CHAP domain-containing protein [Streptomyces caniferus]|uniref:CHAP domain-containing protein n=1 Tax=Streptomyces caniferus TaxID=285557 RepID=UPI002E2B97A7|nr:CHAP domain-containing protein [Streptomyces caniferus]